MKELEFQLNQEALQALFQGKKCELIKYGALGQNGKAVRVIIFPPNYLSNQEIAGALARGYTYDENSNKVLDGNLINAMAIEVEKLLKGKSTSQGFLILRLGCLKSLLVGPGS